MLVMGYQGDLLQSEGEVAKSLGEIEKRNDRKSWRSIEQSERMAARNRKNQRRALGVTGGSLALLGATSAYGDVPKQVHRITHAGREGKNVAGVARQVAGAAGRNPLGAVALGSSAAALGGLGAWGGHRIAESRNQKRANLRRQAYHRSRLKKDSPTGPDVGTLRPLPNVRRKKRVAS